MPNQTDQQTTTNPPPPITSALSPDFQSATTDVPPMPEDTTQSTTSSVTSDSTTPSDLPPIIPPTPKKKFGGERIIATILGILLLVGGVGAGLMLTKQKQLFQSQARLCVDSGCALTTDPNGKNPTLDKSKIQKIDGKEETVDNKSIKQLYDELHNDPNYNTYLPQDYYDLNNASCGRDKDPGAPACCSASTKSSCGGGGTSKVCEAGGRSECKSSSGVHCTMDADSADCGGANPVTKEVEGPNPTPTPGLTAMCQNIKAYSTNWVLLSATELSHLGSGSQVNFCVVGTASSEVFDMARFTINGVLKPDTTTKRSGTTDFCQNYTIPPATTTFDVSAEIHHTTLGWK